MYNVICAIAKCEEAYINDWVKWHINLGFDRIYIYDNSNIEDRKLNEFIDPNYIDFVEFIPVYGVHKAGLQCECYNQFYKTHSFDWCAFIDIDEYIVLNNWNNITEFLNDARFTNAPVIRLNWKMFGDDGLLDRDRSIPVYEGITTWVYKHCLNFNGKHIIRGGLQNVYICSSHYSQIGGVLPKQIQADGKETLAKVGGLRFCNEAHINHYMTKTLSEFIDQKLRRGTDAAFVDRKINFDYFWDINKKTPEKLEYINKVINKK